MQQAAVRASTLDAEASGRPLGRIGGCPVDLGADRETDAEKNDLRPHLREQWVIPPDQNAAFVACMEDVLDLYCQPYDPRVPIVNMDEQPVQLVKETRQPLPPAPGQPERIDYEYERNGTTNLFLFVEALAGWRTLSVRERKTAVDWAHEVRRLLTERHPKAKKVILICDNLNTHGIGSLYEAFPPEEARRLAQRLEIHYTPKHGSWLNIAECELSVFTRQHLSQRIPDAATLARLADTWQSDRNARHLEVHWRFTTEKARIKLHRLYPQYQCGVST